MAEPVVEKITVVTETLTLDPVDTHLEHTASIVVRTYPIPSLLAHCLSFLHPQMS